MRYIVIEKNLGVFVGAFDRYAIFAQYESFGLERVMSFSTKEDAESFIENYLNKEDREFSIETIDSNSEYVLIKDIIRAGFGKYTHYMMNNIPMPSETIN